MFQTTNQFAIGAFTPDLVVDKHVTCAPWVPRNFERRCPDIATPTHQPISIQHT